MSILEDVISREGSGSEDTFTPFDGCKDEIEKQFKGRYKDMYNKVSFLNYVFNKDDNHSGYSDFNITKTSDYHTEGDVLVTSSSNKGWITLEDFMANASNPNLCVRRYVQMMCVGYKNQSRSPVRTSVLNTSTTKTFIDEDGEKTEEYELLVDDKNLLNDMSIKNEAALKIPYLVKKIWDYSLELGSNLFTFIAAVMAMEDNNESISLKSFSRYKTVKIRQDGSFDRLWKHSTDIKYHLYRDSIVACIGGGSENSTIEITQEVIEFIKIMRILDIKLTYDDAVQIDSEFVNNIKCCYLPSMREYIEDYSIYDPELEAALSENNILTTTKGSLYEISIDSDNSFNYDESAAFIAEFQNMEELENGRVPKDEVKSAVINLYKIYLANVLKEECKVDPYYTEYNVLYYNGSIASIPGEYIGTYRGSKNYQIILSGYGYGILLSNDYSDIITFSIDEIYRGLKEYMQYGDTQEALHRRN